MTEHLLRSHFNQNTYRNEANSIGFISTNSLTITEHNEKKNEDNVAKSIPNNGHE